MQPLRKIMLGREMHSWLYALLHRLVISAVLIDHRRPVQSHRKNEGTLQCPHKRQRHMHSVTGLVRIAQ